MREFIDRLLSASTHGGWTSARRGCQRWTRSTSRSRSRRYRSRHASSWATFLVSFSL
jgi:hypothetical protein